MNLNKTVRRKYIVNHLLVSHLTSWQSHFTKAALDAMNLRQHCFGHFRVPEINKPKSSGLAAAIIHFYLPSKENQTKFIKLINNKYVD